jgi:hypothetical protein
LPGFATPTQPGRKASPRDSATGRLDGDVGEVCVLVEVKGGHRLGLGQREAGVRCDDLVGVSVCVHVEERGLGCGDGFGEDGFGVGVEVVEGL